MTQSPKQILSEQTIAAIRTAELLTQRDLALHKISKLLNPSGNLSTWAYAGRVSEALCRYRATSHREPRNNLEAGLAAVCEADCPTSQRRLFDLLVDLRL